LKAAAASNGPLAVVNESVQAPDMSACADGADTSPIASARVRINILMCLSFCVTDW
jgi:hypothetical protein